MFQTSTPPEMLLAQAISQQGSPGFEAPFAHWLHAMVPFDNITALAYFPVQAPVLLMAKAKDASVHANFDDVYLAGAYLLDPFHELHAAGAAEGVYRLDDIAPDQFQRNRYFRDYYSSTSLIDEIGFVLHPSPGVSVHICLGRDSSSNARFSSREMQAARRIGPVVIALGKKHWPDLDSGALNADADVSARLMQSMKARHGISLSPRQAEVALLVLKGNSSVSIGLKLGVSPQTVKVFRKQLYRKCGISSQAELFTMLLPLLGS